MTIAPSQVLNRFRDSSAAIEESVLLRFLVQVLVTLGIASVAIAAIGVTDTSLLNLLAIPLSAVGAFFSWYRRYQRNTAIKFVIAFGMLLALGVFLSRMLTAPSDTRILLAELLIHLQVLHSFDLPRRKDLGYSMMIGLILLGVAATISQTLTFAPLLLLFLMVALPVLMLDYRSRLGLLTRSWGQLKMQLSPWRMAAMLAVTLALGLTIFLLLPRLPGYQIRNFPVSSAVDYDGNFDGQRIINPGYVSEGEGRDRNTPDGGSSSDIQGAGKLSGPGVVDVNFYYGFNRTMNQNLRGTMTPKVLMRVRSEAPGFWRVLAFDEYTGQGWTLSDNEEVMTIRRPSFASQMYLPWRPFEGKHREVIQTYTLVEPFPNLIPALYQAQELYFPTQEVAIDREGSLRAPVGLEKGMTYTVISRVPYRDRTQLRSAPTNYPREIEANYLGVPTAIQDRVRRKTEELLATSPTPLTDPYETALYLAQVLKQRYTIQPELPFFQAEDDLVEAFLFKYEGGYPDHFSTVLAVMLRSIGIPTRLVAGLGVGEYNPFTGFYIVRNTDAYALTDVYFPQHGWFAFDPIPGHELVPPTIREYESFSLVRRFWNWIASWLPSPLVGFLSGLMDVIGRGIARLLMVVVGLFDRGWLGALLGLAGLIGAAFLAWLSWQGWQFAHRRWWMRRLPPMERLYQEMLSWLAHEGLPKRATETPLEYGQRLSQQATPQQAQAANQIAHAYVRWRYGNEPANLTELGQQLNQLRRRRARRSPFQKNSRQSIA